LIFLFFSSRVLEYEWLPFGHGSIEHEPFITLEQWKVS